MSEQTIVAIIVGFGVPVATFVFTYLTAGQTAKREEARAVARADHERRLAHESRVHGWRADAYRDLLRVIRRMRYVIEMTMPVLDEGGTSPPPSPPTNDEMDAMEAAVAAFGSAAIRDRLVGIRRTSNEFFRAVSDYQRAMAAGLPPGSKDHVPTERDVDEIRKRWRAAHNEMRADVARELQELPTT